MKLPVLLFISAMFFSSCSKTPEEAAAEICECYQNADGVLGKLSCLNDQKNYSEKFKENGEDLEKFQSATGLCTLNAGKDVLNDVLDSEEIKVKKEEALDAIGETLEEVKDLDIDLDEVEEKLEELEDEIEDSIDEIEDSMEDQ